MNVPFSDGVAIISAVISLLALFVSFHASFIAQRVATSDFQAVEKVKSDTAQLIAALRALMIKGAVYSQQEPSRRDNPEYERWVDTNPERVALENFMHSSTALAYYSYVAKKSKAARNAGIKSEQWRTFFLQLAELRLESNPWVSAKAAAKLEILFDGIGKKEINEIAGNLTDLPRAISVLFSEREHDVLTHVMVKTDEEPINEDNFIDFVRFLRESKNIDDPELDLFWAASSGDLELLKSAQAKGVNLNIRSGVLIRRYTRYIPEFKQSLRSNDTDTSRSSLAAWLRATYAKVWRRNQGTE